MKTSILTLSLVAALAVPASAAIIVPGANGTDGALTITADTVIDLGLAPTGAWDNDNTANAGKGVYDAGKWAVVFKYTSVTVAAGKTVTFKNNASRAPVVWLVSGNVVIDGTVKLDGQGATSVVPPRLSEPGPGGFRGGNSAYSGSVGRGGGFGPGGGSNVPFDRGYAPSGSFGSLAYLGSSTYGNPAFVPLLGGSGGSGGAEADRVGAAGGGAILIAATSQIQIAGKLSAQGGDAIWTGSQQAAAAGSGGGIRLLADSISGTGSLSASGGERFGQNAITWISGNGRIRLERVTNTNTISVVPAPSLVDLAAGTTALLWPPTGAPEVRIVTLGGVAPPADPKSGFGTIGADVSIPTTATTSCIVETRNVEQASQVKVRITPRDTYDFTEIEAAYAFTVSTNPLVIRWNATLPTNLGYSAVQVKVIRP